MSQMYSSFTFDNNATCDTCHLGKQRKLPYHASNSVESNSFELLHFEIWGPLTIPSIQKHKYFLTIFNAHIRFVWIILLRNKYEVSQKVQNFINLITNIFNTIPKVVRSDNGPEFMLSKFYTFKGIIHQRSCVETLQQNGRVERKHQYLLNVGTANLYQSKLSKQYWSFATFIINRVFIPSPT